MEILRTKSYIKSLVILSVTAAVLQNGAAVSKGMGLAVTVCLETMIPSLYAMMICSELILSCGAHRALSVPLHKPAGFLFGCSGNILVIFLLSQVAGYPVGAKMLCSLSAQGQLSQKQASLLAGVCFGGGPAFLAALFASHSEDSRTVFLAGFLANFLLFCCMSRFLRTNTMPEKQIATEPKGAVLVNAAAASGTALLKICAMVILFGGMLALAEAIGLLAFPSQLLGTLLQISPKQSMQILCGFAEISRITALFPYSTSQLPLLGAMLSFGGICVMLQIAAVSERQLRLGYILLLRCAASALTALLISLWQLLHPVQETASAAVILSPPADIQAGSPLPALFLLVMTAMLLCSVRQK